MSDVDKAIATQLANIEKRTGKTLAELSAIVKRSGLEKHGELVAMLKSTLGMGHGDANTLVHTVRKSAGPAAAQGASAGEVLDGLYTGPKAVLRPIHDKLTDGAAQIRRVRGGAEEDLRELPAEETVRHDRPRHQYAGRGRSQHEGRKGHRAAGRTAGRANVQLPRQADRPRAGRRGIDRLGQDRLRRGWLDGHGAYRPLSNAIAAPPGRH